MARRHLQRNGTTRTPAREVRAHVDRAIEQWVDSQAENLKKLSTAARIVDVLGGNGPVASLTGRKTQHVTNWKTAGTLPANTYLVLKDALARKGYTASPKLWGITPIEQE